jgi:hypothetical protein
MVNRKMSSGISTRIKSYQQYVDDTLIPGIRKMQSERLEFLSFGVIGVSIEALGSFFDTDPFEEDGHSSRRFKKAIDELFKPLGRGYENSCSCKNKMHDDYCLFRGLRCGMAHIGRPQGKIVFTTRAEAQSDNNTHLVRDLQGMLVLVAQDLADDFEAGWRTLKTQSADGKTKKKVTDPYLKVYHYGN